MDIPAELLLMALAVLCLALARAHDEFEDISSPPPTDRRDEWLETLCEPRANGRDGGEGTER